MKSQVSLYDVGMKLSEWVKAARLHKGLTQEKLGAVLHVSKANVSAWENGRHEPSFGQLQHIATVTGYPLAGDQLPGMAASEPVQRHPERPVSDKEWALVEAFRVLPEGEQDEMVTSAIRRAEYFRSLVEKEVKRVLMARGVRSIDPPSDEKVAQHLGLPGDRRQGDRRHENIPVAVERRHGDRRAYHSPTAETYYIDQMPEERAKNRRGGDK